METQQAVNYQLASNTICYCIISGNNCAILNKDSIHCLYCISVSQQIDLFRHEMLLQIPAVVQDVLLRLRGTER